MGGDMPALASAAAVAGETPLPLAGALVGAGAAGVKGVGTPTSPVWGTGPGAVVDGVVWPRAAGTMVWLGVSGVDETGLAGVAPAASPVVPWSRIAEPAPAATPGAT